MHPSVHCSTVYKSQDVETRYLSMDRGLDEDDVAHTRNGLLLSHKKEWNKAIHSNVDGPRQRHAEWSQTEEKYMTSLMKVKMLVAQSCLTLCDPMDCSLAGFSVHGILQATILEWVASPFSRGSSLPRDRTWVSLHCRQIAYCPSHQGSPHPLYVETKKKW